MGNYKEIVTKAVIGKAKKGSKEEITIDTNANIDTVLGCWIINHNFKGSGTDGKVNVEGSYDVNVWYSYENNTKTDVLVRNFLYKDTVNVNLTKTEVLDNNREIIVRSLSAQSERNVEVDGSKVILNIEKELGVEIVGETMVRIAIEDSYEDYQYDDSESETIIEEAISEEVDEDYLEDVNQK